jgi:hypothetical protein
MRIAKVTIKSVGSMLMSRGYKSQKLENEDHDSHEMRTWRERCHYLSDGSIFIPNEMFNNSLKDIAQYLSDKIKGKGQATWSKHFKAGVRCLDRLLTDYKKNDVEPLYEFGHAQGKRGASGPKVEKYYPIIPQWGGQIRFALYDDTITDDIFEKYIKLAGLLIGIGKRRAANGGDFGRYAIVAIEWTQIDSVDDMIKELS